MYWSKVLNGNFEHKRYLTNAPWKYWWANTAPLEDFQTWTDSWDVDNDAIERACRECFGIDRVPKIIMDGRVACGATFRNRFFGIYINVSPHLSPQIATVTLWHELTHVKQMTNKEKGEQEALMASEKARKGIERKSYWDCAWEREARASEVYGLNIPLVKER
jgi:hypothetical protein